jgi:hypothetical protein
MEVPAMRDSRMEETSDAATKKENEYIEHVIGL